MTPLFLSITDHHSPICALGTTCFKTLGLDQPSEDIPPSPASIVLRLLLRDQLIDAGGLAVEEIGNRLLSFEA